MKMYPSELCSEDSLSGSFSPFDTNKVSEFKGATKLKLTSDFFSNLNLKSTLYYWLSIV